jgi:hypothetical protein
LEYVTKGLKKFKKDRRELSWLHVHEIQSPCAPLEDDSLAEPFKQARKLGRPKLCSSGRVAPNDEQLAGLVLPLLPNRPLKDSDAFSKVGREPT